MSYSYGNRCFVEYFGTRAVTTGCIVGIDSLPGGMYSLVISTDIPLNSTPTPKDMQMAISLGQTDRGRSIINIHCGTIGVHVNVTVISDAITAAITPTAVFMCRLHRCNCLRQRVYMFVTCPQGHGICMSHLVPWNSHTMAVNNDHCEVFFGYVQSYMAQHNISDEFLPTRVLLGYDQYSRCTTSDEVALAVHMAATTSAWTCPCCAEEAAMGGAYGNRALPISSTYGIAQVHHQLFASGAGYGNAGVTLPRTNTATTGYMVSSNVNSRTNNPLLQRQQSTMTTVIGPNAGLKVPLQKQVTSMFKNAFSSSKNKSGEDKVKEHIKSAARTRTTSSNSGTWDSDEEKQQQEEEEEEDDEGDGDGVADLESVGSVDSTEAEPALSPTPATAATATAAPSRSSKLNSTRSTLGMGSIGRSLMEATKQQQLKAASIAKGVGTAGDLQSKTSVKGATVLSFNNNSVNAGTGAGSAAATGAGVGETLKKSVTAMSGALDFLASNRVKGAATAAAVSGPVTSLKSGTGASSSSPTKGVAAPSTPRSNNNNNSSNNNAEAPPTPTPTKIFQGPPVLRHMTVWCPHKMKKFPLDVYVGGNLPKLIEDTCSVIGSNYLLEDARLFVMDTTGWCLEVMNRGATAADYKNGLVLSTGDLRDGDVVTLRGAKDAIRSRQALVTLAHRGTVQNNELLAHKLELMQTRYIGWRGVRGDGNCYYRAVYFSLFEQILVDKTQRGIIRKIADILRPLQFTNVLDKLNHADLMCAFDAAIDDDRWLTIAQFESELLDLHSGLDWGLVKAMRRLLAVYLLKNRNEVHNGISIQEAILPSYSDVT